MQTAISLLLAAMAVHTAALALLILLGGRNLRKGGESGPEPAAWPKVSVIVPAAGSFPGMDTVLASIAEQDYPDFEVLYVTMDDSEAAARIIDEVLEAHGAGREHRRATAGQTKTCGQKNHNLLAGLAQASPESEIFVTCDVSHLAPSHWLRALVAPLARGEAGVATGYHHVYPLPGAGPGVAGRTLAVLALYLLQEIPFLTQPWGGNTALSRKSFRDLDVQTLWQENVVDDVSLAMRLAERKQKARAVAGACLDTFFPGENFQSHTAWFTRQWAYLKFCFPGSWLLAGLGLALANLVLLAGLAAPPLALAGVIPPWTGLAGSAYLTLLALLGLWMRSHHPAPPRALPWLHAFFSLWPLALYNHGRTWFSRSIAWGKFRYRLGRKGRVLGIDS